MYAVPRGEKRRISAENGRRDRAAVGRRSAAASGARGRGRGGGGSVGPESPALGGEKLRTAHEGSTPSRGRYV